MRFPVHLTPSRARRAALSAVWLALATVLHSCTFDRPRVAPAGAPTIEQMAQRLGEDVLRRLVRGYMPERSADLAMVAEPHNVVVRWSGLSLQTGTPDPRTTHSSPWEHHQRVPIILYGPGYVRGGLRLGGVRDVADLAPTFAELMRFRFRAPDGRTLEDGILPRSRRVGVPRIIVLVAYDGGGWNLLERWPEAWPELRRLASRGAVYTNATIGSSPSVTAAIHATMGTGAYPRTHGVPDHAVRRPDGSVADVYRGDEADPNLLQAETLADAWDRANGNRPWTGLLATEAWHLGMLGKGTLSAGGDRDPAVFWDREDGRFSTNEDAYELPGYLPDRAVLDGYLRELDSTDGALDDRWMGNDLREPRVILGSPAFVDYQRDALLEMVRREPMGRDGLTDLLFVEFKSTDIGAHIWNLSGAEESQVLQAQDRAVAALVRLLDRRVGPDRYVLAITADHGLTPLPEDVGGLRIHPDVVGLRVDEYFGRDVVERTTPSGLYVDRRVLRDAGIPLAEVARFVATLRYRDVLPADADERLVAGDLLDRRVFAGVLPGSFLERLTEADLRALGRGAYREGNLTSSRHRYAAILRG